MCDLICDFMSCSVSSWDTGKINESDKIMFENQKKRKYGNKRNFYINLHLKDRLDIEFIACYSVLMSDKALKSFSVSDACLGMCS